MQVCDCERRYILTQGPLEKSTPHFWLMVWEQNTKAIVMLNKVIEKKKVRPSSYPSSCKFVIINFIFL